MGESTIQTKTNRMQQAFAANKAVGAYPTLASTNTEPNSKNAGYEGTFELDVSGASQNFGKFWFFGEGSSTNTFNCQIVAWHFWPIGLGGDWVPTVLADLTCTLGTVTSPTTATNRMVSAITYNSGEATYEVVASNATCAIAMLKLDLCGAQRIQIVPGTGSGATKLNALMSGF